MIGPIDGIKQHTSVCCYTATQEGVTNMAAKILGVNMKITNGNYTVALETDDGNTVALIPHSLVSDMKAEYEKAHLQSTRLDNEALVRIMATFADDTKASEPDVLAEMTRLDPPQEIKSTKSVSATGRDTISQKVGKLLASAADVVKYLQEWMDLGIQRKRLPASIPFHMQGVWTKEVRLEMPVPGSVKPENYKGNVLFDKKDDKPGTESWYLGVAEDFPGYWDTLGTPLRELSEAMEKDSTARNRYSGWKFHKQEALKNTLNTRRKALVDAIKQGVTVLNLIDEVHEKTKVKVFFLTTEGEVDATTTPMRIVYFDETKDKTDPDYFYEKYMSVGALLKVDVAKIAALPIGEQFAAFKAERAEGADEEDNGIARITTAEDFERVIGWFGSMNTGPIKDWDSDTKQIVAGFTRRLKAPPSESDPLLRLAMRAKEFLDLVLSDPKFSARYLKIENEAEDHPQGERKVA